MSRASIQPIAFLLTVTMVSSCETHHARDSAIVPNDSIAEHYRFKARDEHDTALMIAYIDTAILYKPFDIWARNWRVDVYRALGQNDSAYAEMKRVLAVCRTEEDSATMLGNYIWDLPGMPHIEEHGDWISKYVRLTMDSSRVYSYMARLAGKDMATLGLVESYLRSAIRTAEAREARAHRENLTYYLLSHADTSGACAEYCQIEKAYRSRLDSIIEARCACAN
jgi:hypothetical protein